MIAIGLEISPDCFKNIHLDVHETLIQVMLKIQLKEYLRSINKKLKGLKNLENLSENR